jgi:FtsH-binding integral membrane protein
MDNNNLNYKYDSVIQLDDASVSRKFLSGVFAWMFVALGISAGVSYLFSGSADLLKLIFNFETGGLTGLGYLALFSPVIFALVMQIAYEKIAYPILMLLFVTYATLIGVSFSIIFLAYTATTIFSMFITTSLVFAVMAIAGYYTHQDLTKMGTILYTVFIGMFIAFMVNYFIGSAKLDYILSCVGVVVFVGLTAYKVQMLKRIGEGLEYGSLSSKKLALIGGLQLYITFINLFMMLLRIFGGGSRR